MAFVKWVENLRTVNAGGHDNAWAMCTVPGM